MTVNPSWDDGSQSERVLLRRFGHRGGSAFNGVKVEAEQAVALVTLLLVLLPEPDDLLQDLHVEAVTLGLGVDVLLILG